VIQSIKHRGLKRLYEQGDRSKIRPDLVDKAESILARLDVASAPEAMNLPGLRLHSLTGNLQGFWSVSLSRNHRIIFRFDGEDVCDVDLVDYH
jgi:proteic killer suppression protein